MPSSPLKKFLFNNKSLYELLKILENYITELMIWLENVNKILINGNN